MSEVLKYYSALKEKYLHSDRKALFQNFIALFILQISNYLLPLIILPFLTQTLLPAGYGEFAWSQYVLQFLIMITDFGFNFSATRQISIHRNDKEKVSKIFTSVMLIKSFLLLFSCMLVFFWIQTESFSQEKELLLWLSVLSAGGSVLFPVWFFQGMERMKWITIINVIFKIIYAVLIFILVKDVSDVNVVAFLFAVTTLGAGIFAFGFVFFQFGIKLVAVRMSDIFHQFRDGWYIFISTFFTTVYVSGNGFILSEWCGDVSAGFFNPAEKIVRAVTSFFNPMLFAFYPFISRKFDENPIEGERMFFSSLKKISIFTFFASLFLFFTADLTVSVLGKEFESSSGLIRWMSVIPFFGVAGAMLSYHLFLNSGLSKLLPWLLFLLMILDLTLCYFLIPVYKENGAAIALCITEISAPLIYLIVYFSKRKTMYEAN